MRGRIASRQLGTSSFVDGVVGVVGAGVAIVAAAAGAARARPARPDPAVGAHLACTIGDAPVSDGARRTVDADVTCAIVVDRGAPACTGAMIFAETALPFGGHTAVVRTLPAATAGGARWDGATFARGSDVLRCATTTLRGTLTGPHGLVWQGALTIRGACPAPTLAPHLTCSMTSFAPAPAVIGADDAPPPPPQLSCAVDLPTSPDVAMHAAFRSDLDPKAPPVTAELVGAAPGPGPGPHASTSLTSTGTGHMTPPPVRAAAALPVQVDVLRATPCAPGYAEAALVTADGAIVWTKRVLVHPCPK